MALLIGYGAGAINPYLAFESIEDMIAEGLHGMGGVDPEQAIHNYIKAAGKGVLKVMSKMGISTVASYTGAQVFEAIGLGHELVDEYFTGTVPAGSAASASTSWPPRSPPATSWPTPTGPRSGPTARLELGGEYQWRREGEVHLFNPETVFKLQHATRAKRYDIFKQYTALVDDQSRKLATLRGLFELQARSARQPVPLDEVEPVSEIVKRFATGRHELRLDLGRGPRDAGHRHEPHGRQVATPARAARTPSATCRCPTATRSARPSSRWPRAGSA